MSVAASRLRGTVPWSATYHGLLPIPPGPENPLEFDCRNFLFLTYFYLTDPWSRNRLIMGPTTRSLWPEMEADMTGKPKRAALDVRVSTDGQTVDNQRLALEAVCEQRGWQVVQVYA